jgi:ribosomal protein S18 acetylase RimI-like enzyme
MSIEVRELDPDAVGDVTAARALFEEYGASLDVDLAFQGFAEELAALPGAYVPPSGALLLADLDGAIVGCAAVRALEGDACELKRLYVRPAARGHGLGRTLTEAALAAARRLGYRRVRLDTLPTMTSAFALYQELGFHEIDPYRFNPVPGTRYLEREL